MKGTDRNLGVGGHPDPLVGVHGRVSMTAAVAVESRLTSSPPRTAASDPPVDHAWLATMLGRRTTSLTVDHTVRLLGPDLQNILRLIIRLT